MIRTLVSTLIALALFLVERSFVAALPEPLSRIPLTLSAGVYLVQHLSLLDGAAWIVVAGVASDLLALTPMGTGTFAATCAALAATALSLRVFTNRSLWGILACGAAAATVHALASAAGLAVAGSFGPSLSGSLAPLLALPWTVLLALAVLSLFFRMARRLRALLTSALRVNRESA